jgi:hypothetical protein
MWAALLRTSGPHQQRRDTRRLCGAFTGVLWVRAGDMANCRCVCCEGEVLVDWSVTAGSGLSQQGVGRFSRRSGTRWLRGALTEVVWGSFGVTKTGVVGWVGGEGGRLLVSGLSQQGVTPCCREAVHGGTVAHVPHHHG